MPVTGPEKDRLNWLNHPEYGRIAKQKKFWPDRVKQLDAESNGVRFRSEILSYEELWDLYVAGVGGEPTPEEESRGKKKSKIDLISQVIPITAFELPGRFSEKGIHHHGEWGYLHFDQWLYARDQARKDLFWLAKQVFDLDVQSHVHQIVCDQFVSKNFDGVYRDGYRLKEDFQKSLGNQSRVPQVWVQTREFTKEDYKYSDRTETIIDYGKYVRDPIQAEKTVNYARTMILLDPRGFFKSSIDAVDCISWIINCPDIRILIVSGVVKLAEQFLAMIKVGPKKRSFYLPKGIRPDVFHLLFPEFVIRGVAGTSIEPLRLSEDTHAPQRHFSADPTLGVISVPSTLTGFHNDVSKFDDIVTDTNSDNEETRAKVQFKADGAVNMLMPWGWHDIIGTRYFPDDYYGLTKKTWEDNPEMFNLKYFERACWKVKPEYKAIEQRNLRELTEDMVDLTFPELAGTPHQSWLDLRKKMKNERSFRCQQLNQPVWGEESTIDINRGLLDERTTKTLSDILPRPGVRDFGYVYGAIDLARENKQFSDFTALAVGKVYQEGAVPVPIDMVNAISIERQDGKWVMVILDVQFGKWSQTEIANRIAAMNDKWHVQQWYGEDTGGLQLLKERINEVSRTTYGHWPYIRWDTPDNSENAKRNRIKGVETLLRTSRLFFLIASWNNEVFEQLERYKGQKSSRYFKDDVPDVISHLARFVPSLVALSKKELEQKAADDDARYRNWVRNEIHKTVFGSNSGGFGMAESAPGSEIEPREQPKGPMGGVGEKFFRGNGLWA
jgi:hypothetical protein